MKRPEERDEFFDMDRTGVIQALAVWQEAGVPAKGVTFRMGWAIHQYIKSVTSNAPTLTNEDQSLTRLYPNEDERAIAQAERTRAVAIIAERFNFTEWKDHPDYAEFSLLLALIQHDIEGR